MLFHVHMATHVPPDTMDAETLAALQAKERAHGAPPCRKAVSGDICGASPASTRTSASSTSPDPTNSTTSSAGYRCIPT